MRPDFLSLEEIVEIHRDQISRYGGEGGIRDLGTLQSAIAAPQASFGGRFLHDDVFGMAAAYLFHIVQDHPFIDGNKRTGAVACIVFLELNAATLQIDEDELEELVMSVAKGGRTEEAVAEFLRARAR